MDRIPLSGLWIPCVLCVFLAQQATASPPSKVGSFYEMVYDNVPTGGSFLRGAMLGTAREVHPTKNIQIQLTTITANSLCVNIITQDGRYEARQEFDLQDTSPGVYSLSLDFNHFDVLKKYIDSGSSVLSTLGNSCPSIERPLTIVPTQWIRTNASLNTIYFLVSSGLYDAFLWYKTPTKDHIKLHCDKFDTKYRTTAYDSICELSLSTVDISSPLTISLYHFNDIVDSVNFTLLFPRETH